MQYELKMHFSYKPHIHKVYTNDQDFLIKIKIENNGIENILE